MSLRLTGSGPKACLPALNWVADILLGADQNSEHYYHNTRVVVVETIDEVVVDARHQVLQRGTQSTVGVAEPP